MGQVYNHLSGEDRNFIHRHLNEDRSCRWRAGHLGRSGPTISREIKRSSGTAQGYDASSAASSYRVRRWRRLVKLREGTMLRHTCPRHAMSSSDDRALRSEAMVAWREIAEPGVAA
jgi:IS30 family transposase